MMNRRGLLIALASGLLLSCGARLAAQDAQADPRAVELMREVYAKRETWDADFPGFEAKLLVVFKGQEQRGTVRVGKDLKVQVTLKDEDAARWATDALRSIVGHRMPTTFESADGKYPLTFGPKDDHPAGRLVRLNDSMNSTYRVRDAQIMQVNRSAGPRLRFTIDIIENLRAESGRYLPRIFTVAYFDSQSGGLKQTETFWDGYRKVGKYYLPEFRRQVTAEDSATQAMQLSLSEIKLL